MKGICDMADDDLDDDVREACWNVIAEMGYAKLPELSYEMQFGDRRWLVVITPLNKRQETDATTRE